MKLKLFLTAGFFLCAAATTVKAQWVKVGYLVNGTDTVAATGFRGYGNDMYSYSDKGLFRSSNNGDSWTNLTAATTITATEKFKSVYKTTSGDLYAGSDLKLFKSTDNGATWNRVSSIPDSLFIQDITQSGANMVIATTKGANYGVYYSVDNGASWTQATGINSGVRHFLHDGNTLYVGGTTEGVYKSTDNGQTWTLAGTGFPTLPGVWTVVKSGDNFLANSISGKGMFISRDNAMNWVNADTAVFRGFCQVFSVAAAGNRIVATMDGQCNAGVPIKTSTDNGETWTGLMDGLTPGFYPTVAADATGSMCFTRKGFEIFRYGQPTSIKKSSVNAELKVYPNPSTGLIIVQVPAGAQTIRILNALGQEIKGEKVNNRTSINLNINEAGIYFVQIGFDDKLFTQKVVVNK